MERRRRKRCVRHCCQVKDTGTKEVASTQRLQSTQLMRRSPSRIRHQAQEQVCPMRAAYNLSQSESHQKKHSFWSVRSLDAHDWKRSKIFNKWWVNYHLDVGNSGSVHWSWLQILDFGDGKQTHGQHVETMKQLYCQVIKSPNFQSTMSFFLIKKVKQRTL